MFETHDNSRSHQLPMLYRTILDYLVNEATMHWLLLRRPEMAQSYMTQHANLRDNVLSMFAKIYNSKRTRRRATDLAGI